MHVNNDRFQSLYFGVTKSLFVKQVLLLFTFILNIYRVKRKRNENILIGQNPDEFHH